VLVSDHAKMSWDDVHPITCHSSKVMLKSSKTSNQNWQNEINTIFVEINKLKYANI